ncbi:MAG: class B sortase [Ruminiclostridium sp.]|nr:class B sortase [Ruminiclostridium sp.]
MPEFESVKKSKTKKKQTVAQSLFPCKGDSVGEVIRKIVFLAAILVLVGATVVVVNFYFIRPKNIQHDADDLSHLRGESNGDVISIPIKVTNSNGETEQKEVTVLKEYEEYIKENEDTVGYIEIYPWIKSPVVQTADNDFYLKHNFYKQPTENGTIFADYEIPITADSTPPNTIIYGHNLLTKNMFMPLLKYRDDGIDFLKENYLINFDTIYEKNQYLVFSVMMVNTSRNQGEVFPFQNYVTFSSKNEFNSFVSECLDRSYYYTGIDLQYGDELLTLSTCDFSLFQKDVRLVVVARKVRDDESSILDTDKFIDNTGFDENGNSKRRMFEAYYRIYGGSTTWGGRTWDTSWIKDFEEKEDVTTKEEE